MNYQSYNRRARDGARLFAFNVIVALAGVMAVLMLIWMAYAAVNVTLYLQGGLR